MMTSNSTAQPEIVLPMLKSAEPVTNVVATVIIDCDAVRVLFPEKRDDFRTAIKSLGYRWNSVCWLKPTSFMTGSGVDRAAEAARYLVGEGFIVDVRDPEAHAKAIDGSFEPERTRWITKVVGQKSDVWFRIIWRRDEDLYDLARTLPGSMYGDGAVWVPTAHAEAIADFADMHDFALSEGALQIINDHRKKLEHGIVLNVGKKKKTKAKPVATDGRPVKMSAPVDVGVDDDLRDDD